MEMSIAVKPIALPGARAGCVAAAGVEAAEPEVDGLDIEG